MHEPEDTRPAVRLRHGEWERRMEAKGLSSDHARAQRIGMSRTTVARVQDGTIEPGERFVAAVLLTFADLKFEDLFEVVEAERKSA